MSEKLTNEAIVWGSFNDKQKSDFLIKEFGEDYAEKGIIDKDGNAEDLQLYDALHKYVLELEQLKQFPLEKFTNYDTNKVYVNVDDLVKYLITNAMIAGNYERKQALVDAAGLLSKLLDK